MKLLLLAFLLGFAAADFVQQSDSSVDQVVLSFYQGAAKAGSLSETLGIYGDPIIDQMADDAEAEIGKTLKDALKEILEKIQDNVEQGKKVGRDLLEKVKELRQKLKESGELTGDNAKKMLQKIREQAKKALKDLLEKLGFGKKNMDDSMDRVARLRFQEIVEKVRAKLLSDETIQKIRNYIKNIYSESQLVKKLQDLMDTLQDADIREILQNFLGYRPEHPMDVQRAETWERVKEFFKGLNVKIQEHSKKFGEWVQDMWGKGLEKMKHKYGVVKAIAMEFITNSKDISSEMAREALEFFLVYKDVLGEDLWEKIVDATKEAIGKF